MKDRLERGFPEHQEPRLDERGGPGCAGPPLPEELSFGGI